MSNIITTEKTSSNILKSIISRLPSSKVSLESFPQMKVEKPMPIPEFCLGQEHLYYVSGYLDGITKAFNADKFPSLGMMWSNIYPLLYSDNETAIMVKKSRSRDPVLVLQDIKWAESRALKWSIRQFAPVYAVGPYIVQRMLTEDKTIPYQQSEQQKNVYAEFISQYCRGEDGIYGSNIVMTAQGPGLFDLESCNFMTDLEYDRSKKEI